MSYFFISCRTSFYNPRNEKGVEILPVTMVDGAVVKTTEYPSNEEFARYLNMKMEELLKENKIQSCCCSGDC